MRIEFGKRCSMMKEAMSLLEFAVNVDETERRRYLSKLGRFGEEKEPGILLQKELLEACGAVNLDVALIYSSKEVLPYKTISHAVRRILESIVERM